MKYRIKLTESALREIVSDTLKKVLNEGSDQFETYYRGYNSKYGSQRDHLLWLTDDIEYARTYGNRVEEVVIDWSKIHQASMYKIDAILGYEFDYLDAFDEEDAQKLLDEGYNAYGFEANHNMSWCICLWDPSPIVSRRELSREEFDAIEMYDDNDYKQYDDDYDRR